MMPSSSPFPLENAHLCLDQCAQVYCTIIIWKSFKKHFDFNFVNFFHFELSRLQHPVLSSRGSVFLDLRAANKRPCARKKFLRWEIIRRKCEICSENVEERKEERAVVSAAEGAESRGSGRWHCCEFAEGRKWRKRQRAESGVPKFAKDWRRPDGPRADDGHQLRGEDRLPGEWGCRPIWVISLKSTSTNGFCAAF